MDKIFKNKELLLAAQGGLLDAVTPNLRGVAVEWLENTVLVFFYYDGAISDLDQKTASIVSTEVVADFFDADIKERITRLDYPNRLSQHDFWAYRRKEPNIF